MPRAVFPYEFWQYSKFHPLWVREVTLHPRFSGIALHPNTYSAWLMRTGEANVRVKDSETRCHGRVDNPSTLRPFSTFQPGILFG